MTDGSYWPKWLVDWIERDSKSWSLVPRIRYGYVAGQTVRWEKAGAETGSDYQSSALANKFLKNIGAAELGLSADYGITHLQKQSRFGFLVVEPFCFYMWWQIRPQSMVMDGPLIATVPGSELCPTFRVGKGRWDALLKNYIKPTLQAGLHWD